MVAVAQADAERILSERFAQAEAERQAEEARRQAEERAAVQAKKDADKAARQAACNHPRTQYQAKPGEPRKARCSECGKDLTAEIDARPDAEQVWAYNTCPRCGQWMTGSERGRMCFTCELTTERAA